MSRSDDLLHGYYQYPRINATNCIIIAVELNAFLDEFNTNDYKNYLRSVTRGFPYVLDSELHRANTESGYNIMVTISQFANEEDKIASIASGERYKEWNSLTFKNSN